MLKPDEDPELLLLLLPVVSLVELVLPVPDDDPPPLVELLLDGVLLLPLEVPPVESVPPLLELPPPGARHTLFVVSQSWPFGQSASARQPKYVKPPRPRSQAARLASSAQGQRRITM